MTPVTRPRCPVRWCNGSPPGTAYTNTPARVANASAALSVLASVDGPERDQALAEFYGRWRHDPLVLDKWFTVQATSSLPDTLARVRELTKHADFTLKNPNRVRALVGAFAMSNQARFHARDGSGYAFLTDLVLDLDALNPQVAARMVSAMNQWRRFEPARRALMEQQLRRIAAREGLSKDTYEIVARALA